MPVAYHRLFAPSASKRPAHLGRSPLRPRVRAVLALAGLLLCLAACGPAASSSTGNTGTPTAVPSPTSTPTPTVVFTADWSKGLAAWHPTAGWSIHDGALQSDSGHNRTVTIPFQPSSTNYEIEYTMTVYAPHNYGSCVLTAAPHPTQDGYTVYLGNLQNIGYFQFANYPQFGVMIDPDSHDGQAGPPYLDFNVGTKPHTYLVQVSGPDVSVTVDGKPASAHNTQSTATSTLSEGPLTITCTLAGVQISSLTISTL